MKKEYFIDGFEVRFSTLREAKDHLQYGFTHAEKKAYFAYNWLQLGGFIYKVVDGDVVGGIPFFYKERKFIFSREKKIKEILCCL